MTRLLAAAVAVLLACAPAVAHHDGDIVEANGIRASHAHAEPVAANSHGFDLYLTLENTGDAQDRLVAASVAFAAPGRFEANVIDADGTLAVRTVPAVALAPGQTIVLQPGSLRIAFDDLQRTLEPGMLFDVTLTFERAGTLALVAEVEHDDDHDHAADDEHHHEDEGEPQS